MARGRDHRTSDEAHPRLAGDADAAAATPLSHRPNEIPSFLRWSLFAIGLVLLAYAISSLGIGKIYLPGKRAQVYTGIATVFIASGAMLIALSAFSVLLDHYDRRPNEATYAWFRKYAFFGGLLIALAAPIVEVALTVLRNDAPPVAATSIAPTATVPTLGLEAHAELFGMLHRACLTGLFVWMLPVTVVFLADRFSKGRNTLGRVAVPLGIVMFVLMTGLFATALAQDIALGRVQIGGTYLAAADYPAEFRASMLARGLLVLGMTAFSGFGVFATVLAALSPRTQERRKAKAVGRHKRKSSAQGD